MTASTELEHPEGDLSELQERLQFLENALVEQQDSDNAKTTFILNSGAQLTHNATPHAYMHPSTGTLTETANGQRENITHRGIFNIQTKNKTIQLTAVHTPKIIENLL